MRRALVVAILAAFTLTACGSSTGKDASDGSTPSSSSSSTAVDIHIKGDTITPNGDRVQAKTGVPVTLHVTSDRAGELHVHSTPEQELEYDKGRTTVHLTIDKPGIVDVEDHHADVVILQLEVS